MEIWRDGCEPEIQKCLHFHTEWKYHVVFSSFVPWFNRILASQKIRPGSKRKVPLRERWVVCMSFL